MNVDVFIDYSPDSILFDIVWLGRKLNLNVTSISHTLVDSKFEVYSLLQQTQIIQTQINIDI